MTLLRTRGALATATAALAVALSACGADDAESSGPTASSAAPSSAAGESAAQGPGEPFGDCGDVATAVDDPVATAASKNPALARLVDALTAADLVDAFNSAPDVTVLAPADPAFEAVPADDMKVLIRNTARLSAVLTHHVIEGRLGPDRLAGRHTTLAGDTVTIEGSGEDFTVGADQTIGGEADAGVICGNLQTANATVYVIDQVLAPPAA